MRKILLYVFFFVTQFVLFSQPHTDTNTVLRFDFNDRQVKENNNQVPVKSIGTSLVQDRFGNERSALHIFGNSASYLNLGTSELLKPKQATIAMWVNMQEAVLLGKGYLANPLLITKCAEGEDFIIAYGMSYNITSKRVGAGSYLDSLKSVGIAAKDTITFNTWHHLVFTYGNHYFCFYMDGELQGKQFQDYDMKFLKGDSVLIGRTTGDKNQRYSHAIFDDIVISHRILNEEEVKALYNEPNPNYFKNLMNEVLKYGGIILLLVIIIVILMIRNRRKLKRQKEYYEMANTIRELEIKVVKTQMNPHFISNCLSAIQNLIYSEQIDKAAEYLSNFSAFLRHVLDYSDRHYLSLAKELEIIALYVDLEQLRFKNNFTFTIDVEKDLPLAEVQIPALLTQPFIENAIWHGLLPLKERNPKLSIRIYTENAFVIMCIEDNGVGRTNIKTTTTKSSRGTHLASDKIDSINRLRDNKDFRFEMIDLVDERNLPVGTTIIIYLPYIREE